MCKRLIVNADDFGLSEGVNYGIIKAFKEGIVTSATIMANMPGFAHAVELSKQYPELAIGVHLTLTTYKPVVTTHKNIVDKDGYFLPQSAIDHIDVEEAYQELKAQISKVIDSGIPIDHFDSHHHIHTQPSLKVVMEKLYEEYQLPFRGGFLYETNIREKSESNIQFYDKGVSIESFKTIVSTLSEHDVTELMCHPAYIDSFLYQITSYNMLRMKEVDILCDEQVKRVLQEEVVSLLTYSQL